MHRYLPAAFGLFLLAGIVTAADDKEDAALARARDQVRMLDDLYKTAVVSITANYVDKQSQKPAATVAKDVFKAMADKGYHTARLLDASGRPVRKANVAATDFEKRAVEAIKAGKPYFEEIGEVNGKRVLRAATVVPAVMQQCVDCHPHVKMGEVLGVIAYEVPVK